MGQYLYKLGNLFYEQTELWDFAKRHNNTMPCLVMVIAFTDGALWEVLAQLFGEYYSSWVLWQACDGQYLFQAVRQLLELKLNAWMASSLENFFMTPT